MATVLSVVEVIMSVILIFLVPLHSGKDAGLSGAFGIGGGGSALGGGSLVERNLTRWTIFFGILWALNAIVILKLSARLTLRLRAATLAVLPLLGLAAAEAGGATRLATTGSARPVEGGTSGTRYPRCPRPSIR